MIHDKLQPRNRRMNNTILLPLHIKPGIHQRDGQVISKIYTVGTTRQLVPVTLTHRLVPLDKLPVPVKLRP